MWPFNKKYSLAESGILKGMTDYHCHILPGVDDGVQTLEESIQVLAKFEEAGIQTVWLTPHIMEDIPNTTAQLQHRFQELKAKYAGNITLHLAAENMLDSLFDERLSAADVYSMIDDRHLLVETSYYNSPMGLDDILLRIQTKGFIPLLAHPERYMYMGKKDYDRLKAKNIKFQLNLPSLVGHYGTLVQHKAEELLKKGMYNYVGTDTHSLAAWNMMCQKSTMKKDSFYTLQKLLTQ